MNDRARYFDKHWWMTVDHYGQKQSLIRPDFTSHEIMLMFHLVEEGISSYQQSGLCMSCGVNELSSPLRIYGTYHIWKLLLIIPPYHPLQLLDYWYRRNSGAALCSWWRDIYPLDYLMWFFRRLNGGREHNKLYASLRGADTGVFGRVRPTRHWEGQVSSAKSGTPTRH